MNLKTPLFTITGIGPTFAQKLKLLNLYDVEDFVHHYPFRYDDFSNITNTLDAQVGQKVTLQGEIWSIKNIYTRSKKVLTQAIFNDGSSPITLTWFNQSYLTKSILVGDKLQISGKVSKYKNKLSIVAPVWEKMAQSVIPDLTRNDSLHTGRLVPVYSETFGLTSKWIRNKMALVLERVALFIEDPLPDQIRDARLGLREALNKIHFPQNYQDIEQARERLGFDELFYIQLATLKAREEWRKKPAIEKLTINNDQLSIFLKSLPFKLTKSQQKVIGEIVEDLQKPQPMNRLVQGEVGSGKTIVAAAIIYLAHLNGFQSLYMAPTEILAFQHYDTLTKILSPFGINVGIYTGSRKSSELRVKSAESKKQKTLNSELITHNSQHVIVGTHALLSDKLIAENVGLIVVDEQQRFGVEQRTILRNKAKVPHFLTMTATPIPRTVALTLYGDLDLSIIDELPVGRQPIKTHVVPNKKRADAYQFIANKIKTGDQVYIITPLIEESETLQSVKAAKVEFEKLKKQIFPQFRVGLLHGRLKPKEKEEVLNKFKDHKLDILVSTSVVEVGVDVPNATIMVVEGAERFGLAQLHQLRGRVGRGKKESFCFLFAGQEDSSTTSRLKNLEKTSNGLVLSELDLKIRGSGEIFGIRQSGRFELKIASFNNLTLIESTREAAKQILSQDPRLDKHPQLRLKLQSLSPGVMPD